MNVRWIVAIVLLAPLTGWADTNLVTLPNWIVDGAVDSSPAARNINIVVDKLPAGAFSELKVYYNFGGTDAMQVFSVTGRGAIRPSLPPPGEPGGSFLLTGYLDCEQGFVGDMAITDLEFRSKAGKNAPLVVRGQISNENSLKSVGFTMKFYPAQTNNVMVDVRYRLKATRDVCVDTPGHAANFQIARMQSNFMSADTNQNNRIRLVKLDQRICDPYTGCHSSKSSLCADLAGIDGYVFGKPRKLAEAELVLLHTLTTPGNTPTLAITFRGPRHNHIKGQGQVTGTTDPRAENVSVWGNWVDARQSYKANRSVGRFHYRLEARDPKDPNCDQFIGQ